MTQHDQLIAAGWTHDAARDAYQQPETGRWLDPRSAWGALQREGRPARAEKAGDDPRRSKPQ